MILGLVAAAGTAILTNLGLIAQKIALDSRGEGRSIFAAFLRPLWIGGFGLIQVGWLLQLLALKHAPLYVVQPIVASGLLVLAGVARLRLGEPVGRNEWIAISAVVVGAGLLSVIATSAGVGAEGAIAPAAAIAALATSTAIAVGLAMTATRMGRSEPHEASQAPAVIMALSAGVAYAVTVALSKPISAQITGSATDALGAVLSRPEIYLLAIFSISALIANQRALSWGRAVTVVPTVVVTMTVLPVIAGPTILGERLPSGVGALAIMLATAICIAGVAALARVPSVARLAGDDEDTRAGGDLSVHQGSSLETRKDPEEVAKEG